MRTSSSLYSSFGMPHFVHLSLTASSPTLRELCLIIKGLSLDEYNDAEESILDCWGAGTLEPSLEFLPQTLEALLDVSTVGTSLVPELSSFFFLLLLLVVFGTASFFGIFSSTFKGRAVSVVVGSEDVCVARKLPFRMCVTCPT